MTSPRHAGMYVESPSRTYQAKDGSTRTYQTHLLRRSFRDGGKVKKETLANLSALPDSAIAALDWLLSRQDAIEKKLAARHLEAGGLALFDLSSAWLEGHSCPLGAFGHSRDGKKSREQIEFGMVTSRAGIPVAVP